MSAGFRLAFTRPDKFSRADRKRVRDASALCPSRHGSTARAGVPASVRVVANVHDLVVANDQMELHLVPAQAFYRGRGCRIVHAAEEFILYRNAHRMSEVRWSRHVSDVVHLPVPTDAAQEWFSAAPKPIVGLLLFNCWFLAHILGEHSLS